MPFFRSGAQLVFFAHVPKCAGSSVDGYLQTRFGPLAFHDEWYKRIPVPQRWSNSSPQHIDAAALEALIPFSFFDAGFAVVRHPAARLRSVFLFQRDIKRLPPDADFAHWIEAIPMAWRRSPFYLDNHTRPMHQMVPKGCTVFRMEEGLGKVIAWLDNLVGDTNGPRDMPTRNVHSERMARLGRGPEAVPDLTPEIRARIADLYAEDYVRFGYAPEGPEPDSIP